MKNIIYFIIILFMCCCSVPKNITQVHDTIFVKNVSTEILYDSIYVKDSTLIKQVNDTIFITKYKDKLVYKNRIDSIRDTIRVVENKFEQKIIKEKYTPWYYKMSVWIAILTWVLLILYFIFRLK